MVIHTPTVLSPYHFIDHPFNHIHLLSIRFPCIFHTHLLPIIHHISSLSISFFSSPHPSVILMLSQSFHSPYPCMVHQLLIVYYLLSMRCPSTVLILMILQSFHCPLSITSYPSADPYPYGVTAIHCHLSIALILSCISSIVHHPSVVHSQALIILQSLCLLSYPSPILILMASPLSIISYTSLLSFLMTLPLSIIHLLSIPRPVIIQVLSIILSIPHPYP